MNLRLYITLTVLVVNIIISNSFYYWLKEKLGNEKAFLLAFTTAQNLPALLYSSITYSMNPAKDSPLFYSVLAIYLSSIAIIFTQHRRIVWHGIPCIIDTVLLIAWG